MIFGMSMMSACSALPVNDYCIESAPGLSSAALDGSELGTSQISLAFEGDGQGVALNQATFLANQGITGTFFVSGKSIADGETDSLDAINQLGHHIGNRAFTGEPLTEVEDFTTEVRLTRCIFRRFVRNNVFLFALLKEFFNDDQINKLNREGLNKYIGPIATINRS